jgi:hypothetical protein
MDGRKNLTEDTNTPEVTEAVSATTVVGSELAMKLVAEMLAGNIVDIKPQLDFAAELGFTYPSVEQVLEVNTRDAVFILESLVEKGILRRDFFDRLLRCPHCHSMNLRPSTHCPECGAADIVRGRILEHLTCKHIGIEDEFVSRGRYICPECHEELRTLGVDYESLGLQRKCLECGKIFDTSVIKWRCLKCSSLSAEDKVTEVNVYSYNLEETKRSWLEFELKPKSQFIDFLKQHGYEVTENAKVKGRSGAEHTIDLLAVRDDGIITYNIAVGVEVAGEKIGLEKIFDFDDKAYDTGIHDKILIVIPSLGGEAESFASQQRIKVLEVRDLEAVLASGGPQTAKQIEKESFEFQSKSQLIEYLKRHAYQVEENAEVTGRSGAKHNLDILATRDDGIVTHYIAVGIEVAEDKVELDKVFAFDDKAYDSGLLDKVFIAVPRLSREARQFAQRQRIKVFEVAELEPSS